MTERLAVLVHHPLLVYLCLWYQHRQTCRRPLRLTSLFDGRVLSLRGFPTQVHNHIVISLFLHSNPKTCFATNYFMFSSSSHIHIYGGHFVNISQSPLPAEHRKECIGTMQDNSTPLLQPAHHLAFDQRSRRRTCAMRFNSTAELDNRTGPNAGLDGTTGKIIEHVCCSCKRGMCCACVNHLENSDMPASRRKQS